MGLGMARWVMTLPHHWGGTMVGGNRTLRAFNVRHHKSAARSATLHLRVNIFMEEIVSSVSEHAGSWLQALFSKTV